MGVFLYSNKPIETEKVTKVFESRGHKNVICDTINGKILVHARKILVDTKNFLKGESLNNEAANDYIIGIGTYFYNGFWGEKALLKIYQDLDIVLEENLVYGHWAFVVHKGGKTYIFSDMSGSMRLYLWEKNGQLVVTSSMTAAYATIDQPKFDRIRLSAFLAGGMGCDGPFVEGVENFNSLKYVVVKEDGTYQWVKRSVPEVKRIDTIEEAVSYVKGLFAQQLNQLKAIGNEKISIELTGGLDSRLISSNLRTAGFNYDFLNYPLFGPDKEIAVQISEGLRKRLLIQTNIPIQGRIEDHFGEFDYGFNYFRQYANPRWVIENRLQFSGALGECLTTPLSVDIVDDARIENLLTSFTSGKLMADRCKKDYVNHVISYYEERGFKRGQQLSQKDIARFEMILLGQLSGDFMYNSGCQAHIFFYNMFIEWHFAHFVSDIAFDVKNGRKLSIALIKAIDPELADYPFVSRRRTKRKSVNLVTELPLHYFSFNPVKKSLPKGLVDLIYEHMGRSFDKDRFNYIDLNYYKEIVDVKELKSHRNLYCDTLNRMYSVEVLRKQLGIA